MLRCVMLILLVSLSHAGAAQERTVVVLDSTTGLVQLGDRLALWEDQESVVTWGDVQGVPFRAAAEEVPSFGYTDAVVWARFTIRNEAPGTVWLLEIANKSLDAVTLATPTDSSYVLRRVGDAQPFSSRAVQHRNFVFPLDLPAGKPQTYYLRVASQGPLTLPLRIWEAETFLRKDQQEQFFLGSFFGMLAIMVIYNVVLFVVFRDQSYLYYVLYLVSYFVYQLSVERIAFQYFWPEGLWWMARASTVLGLITAIWALQFTRSYLHTTDYVPRLDRVIQALIGVCLVLMGLALAGVEGINALVVLFFIVMVGVVMTAGVRCLMKGDRAARYYLLAWSFLLAGILIGMLQYLGAIPHNPLAARSVQVGAVLEVMLLSLGLGYRYNQLRREREHLRLRIASDLHDDIGSGLTQISLYSELVRRQANGEAQRRATQIGTLARDLTTRMQDIVWAIKPEDETWAALELRLKDFAKELLGARDLTVDMQGTVQGRPPVLSPDVRQNVLLMVKEMLHNTVKHAQARHVEVRWRLTRQALHLCVADDGEGFDPQEVVRGNGLDSLQHRASEIGAHLEIETQPGKGTVVTLNVPLGRGAS